jgi:hypothetical protein
MARLLGKINYNQSGSVVLLTLLILSSVIMIVLVASTLTIQGVKASRNQEYSAIAYFAAESGAERILLENRINGYEYTKTPNPPVVYCADADCISFTASPMGCVPCSDSSINNVLNNGASYIVKYVRKDPDDTVYLLATGSFQGVSRSVEVSYKY